MKKSFSITKLTQIEHDKKMIKTLSTLIVRKLHLPQKKIIIKKLFICVCFKNYLYFYGRILIKNT